MQLFYGFQGLVLTALGVAALACELFAFIDALRHPEGAYLAASKRTRTFWLILFALLGFVAAAVYLADVRPALRQVRGLGKRSDSGW